MRCDFKSDHSKEGMFTNISWSECDNNYGALEVMTLAQQTMLALAK